MFDDEFYYAGAIATVDESKQAYFIDFLNGECAEVPFEKTVPVGKIINRGARILVKYGLQEPFKYRSATIEFFAGTGTLITCRIKMGGVCTT